MRAPHSLSSAQERIRALVTAPDGVRAALDAAGDPGGAGLSTLLRGDRGLDAEERLGVYAHAWFERLRVALTKDYPDLACALGDDAFHDLVRVHLLLRPPHRPSIRDAGEGLADLLRTEAVAEPFRRRLPCAADLAAFEWAQTEAFDAADAATLARETLAALAPEAWPSLRLRAVPSLRLLALAHPVHALGDAPTPEAAGALAAEPTLLCVWRQEERVRFRTLSASEHAALEAIAGGAAFGDVCAVVAGHTGAESAPAEAAALLSRWVADGVLADSDPRS